MHLPTTFPLVVTQREKLTARMRMRPKPHAADAGEIYKGQKSKSAYYIT